MPEPKVASWLALLSDTEKRTLSKRWLPNKAGDQQKAAMFQLFNKDPQADTYTSTQLGEKLAIKASYARKTAERLCLDIEAVLVEAQLSLQPEAKVLLLVEALQQRGGGQLAAKEATKWQPKAPQLASGSEKFFHAYAWKTWERHHAVVLPPPALQTSLPGLLDQFDLYWRFERLRLLCALAASPKPEERSQAQLAAQEAPPSLPASLLSQLPSLSAADRALIEVYQIAWQFLVDGYTPNLNGFWQLFTQHCFQWRDDERHNLYRLYLNHVLRQERANLHDPEWASRALEAYSWAFEHKLPFADGHVLPFELFAYFSLSLRVDAPEGACQVLETYLSQLPPDRYDHYFHLCWGLYHLDIGDDLQAKAHLNHNFKAEPVHELLANLFLSCSFCSSCTHPMHRLDLRALPIYLSAS